MYTCLICTICNQLEICETETTFDTLYRLRFTQKRVYHDLLTGTLTDYIFSVIVTVLRFSALFVLRDTARVRNMTREQQMTSPQLLRRATLYNILATYIKGGYT